VGAAKVNSGTTGRSSRSQLAAGRAVKVGWSTAGKAAKVYYNSSTVPATGRSGSSILPATGSYSREQSST
jgi:hypothetical protein